MGPKLISCVLNLKKPQRNELMGLITFWLGVIKLLSYWKYKCIIS